jgi:hypothetical protein
LNTRQGFGLVGLEQSVPAGCLGRRGPEDVVPIKQAGLWIRIRINLSCWIRIRIQEGKNDLQIYKKSKEFSCFEMLDVLFCGLMAFPVACASFMQAYG